MALVPKKIEEMFVNLFNTAQTLIDTVLTLKDDVDEFKEAIRFLREDLEKFTITIGSLEDELKSNTDALKEKK